MQRLMFLALLVVAVAAAFSSQTRQGRRWVWPSSDAERFSSFSYRSLGDRSVGRSLRRLPPPGVSQNRLVTSVSGSGGRCPLIPSASCPARTVLLSGVDPASLRPCSNDGACPTGTRCCYHPCLTLSLCLTPAGNFVTKLL
ncbi:uncharacterized protein LOC122366588 [Amphibalanus amphitrite]|uniref:uncharacterized protein LOC122366588 n=1 Tax=Amphibalanus amphitrite TaxID=1232801 RepID=UPI001C923630|nr:uncharacterized protein LOC122366588 [Amphibalanus amphitrite]